MASESSSFNGNGNNEQGHSNSDTQNYNQEYGRVNRSKALFISCTTIRPIANRRTLDAFTGQQGYYGDNAYGPDFNQQREYSTPSQRVSRYLAFIR